MTSQSNVEKKEIAAPERTDRRAILHELLNERWSPRPFSEKPIESWKVLSLFEAARWTPSSANEQPWNLIVVTKEESESHADLLGSLSEGNRRWAGQAPLLVIGVAKSTYERTGRANRHAWYDLGQSVANLTVQASSVGLAIHQMGGFDSEGVRGFFSIPDGYEPVVVLAIGYAESASKLPADLQQRETAPRSRKTLEEFVFTKQWGTPSPYVLKQNPLLNVSPSKN